MRLRAIFKSVAVGAIPLITLLMLLNIASAIDVDVQELDLSVTGFVHELNMGPNGQLWISEYQNDRLWQYDPASGVYTIYTGLKWVSDAKPAPDGTIWYASFDNGELGRYAPGAGIATTWPVSPQKEILGIAFDTAGKTWTTNPFLSYFYSFDPDITERCNYDFPDGGASEYILIQDEVAWLGDWKKHRIVAFDPATNQATLYQLGGLSHPSGLVMDDAGDLWFADRKRLEVSRLDADTATVTRYNVPTGGASSVAQGSLSAGTKPRMAVLEEAGVAAAQILTGPTMLAYREGRIWFSQEGAGTLGRLAPIAAQGTSSTVPTTTATIMPICHDVGPGLESNVNVGAPTAASWSQATYTPTVVSDGWSIFQIPNGGHSWGVAAGDNQAWATIQETQKLAWLSFNECFYLVPKFTGLGATPTFTPTKSTGCGNGQFAMGEVVTLTATPDSDWQMAGWTGTINDSSTSSTNTVVMPAADHLVYAHYSQRCFRLFLLREPAGSGDIPEASIPNSAGCSSNHYEQGEVITLTARPAEGWSVFGWEGTDDDSSRADENQVTMPALDHIVKVIYAEVNDIFLPMVIRK